MLTKEVNYSEIFANAMVQELDQKFRGKVRVEHVTLPVSYARAFDTLTNYIKSLPTQPNWIISVGQSKSKYIVKTTVGGFLKKGTETETIVNRMRIETMAHNQISTDSYDNDDFVAASPDGSKAVPIDSSKPKSFGFNLPIQDIYCSLPPAAQELLLVSIDAGEYVCNQLSFKIMDAVTSGQLQSQFVFVHVPFFQNSVETEARFIEKNVEPVNKFAIQMVKKAKRGKNANYFMPTDQTHIKSLAEANIKRKDASEQYLCLANFYSRMVKKETPQK